MNMSRTPAIALVTLGIGGMLALTGCTGAPAGPATSGASSAPAAAPSSPATVTAKDVLQRLVAKGLPVTASAVQDEGSDPNGLMGRPHQYVSRASFETPSVTDDTGAKPGEVARGGVVEVFATPADADARGKYIETVTKGIPALVEYDYVHGTVLLRISGKVSPSLAAQFGAAIGAQTS